ncbi:MAG: hypothetical protein HY720_24655 [Planctomycetes bacterium]|nr:hypothetical protein [Planctomycetota bacterium]
MRSSTRLRAGLSEAIPRAQERVLARQGPTGAWAGENDQGPMCTAVVLVLERFLGILDPADATASVRWLRSRQFSDGSFADNAFSPEGEFNATCYVVAGLRAAGVPDSDPAAGRAWAFLQRHGGLERARMDTRLYLAMVGLVDARTIPVPPWFLHLKLVPGLERLSVRFVASWVPLWLNILPALARGLRQPDRGGALFALERARVARYLGERQNPDGSWYGTTVPTVLGLAAARALGLPADDPLLARGISRIGAWKIRDAAGLRVPIFTSEVWDTTFAIESLLDSGLPTDHPALVGGVDFLLGEQSRIPLPEDLQNPRKGSSRVGGWTFGAGNPLYPDCDDTAVVLAALGPFLRVKDSGRIRGPFRRGLGWLLGMQNRDGGWPAFTRGHRSKKPGPLPRGPFSELQDHSAEGITGRVLLALGRAGWTAPNPVVRRALSFLRRQRDRNGAWWGRFLVNYLPESACVLRGARAVGEDPRRPYLREALGWMVSRQNPDGGWGEAVESYDDAREAGRGRSTPSITAHVLLALVDCGEARSPAALRASSFLLERQDPGGGWQDLQVQGVAVHSLSLYFYNDVWADVLALRALARLRAALDRA